MGPSKFFEIEVLHILFPLIDWFQYIDEDDAGIAITSDDKIPLLNVPKSFNDPCKKGLLYFVITASSNLAFLHKFYFEVFDS